MPWRRSSAPPWIVAATSHLFEALGLAIGLEEQAEAADEVGNLPGGAEQVVPH
jgi:hypothetical protein